MFAEVGATQERTGDDVDDPAQACRFQSAHDLYSHCVFIGWI